MNQLIEGLPPASRASLLALCEPATLRLSEVLGEAGALTTHVYFPTASFVSLIAELDTHHRVEVGMAGREGMVGMQLALGLRHDPLRTLVQGAGAAWRVPANAFRQELARNRALRERLLRYAAVLMGQRANAAACMRYHEIGPRLSRWLLMSQDRASSATFPVTQEFLAAMLGVRRVGVTGAAVALQQRGLIRYHRGQLTVLDRTGLEAAACTCYAADRRTYVELMADPASDGNAHGAAAAQPTTSAQHSDFTAEGSPPPGMVSGLQRPDAKRPARRH
ncbi:MAG: Crp/Fnr family transcriptional regulator [Rubrivivax sp.]|nr:MAG: Crp/Fnr family transcriptional regulator [Rubrivivax sp.]